ncbi:MAG: hypothetical protein ACRDQB_17565 [Thermocrispum sp.]
MGVTVLLTALLAGFLLLWDDTLQVVWRVLGIRAMAINAPLHLIAPAGDPAPVSRPGS